MDAQRLRRGAGMGTSGIMDLPEYIITSFIPGAQPLLAQYPAFFRFLGVILALWYLGPIARLQSLWNRFSSVLVATVTVSSEEDLFGYFVTYLAERRTLRADQSLNAISNPPQEIRRNRRDNEVEESARRTQDAPKIKYEQGQGMQIFIHKKRIFFVTRKDGEGHTYVGNRYKRIENLNVSCLGRSTTPVKELLEEIFYKNKDKERTLTIIRRPYSGGYNSRLSWSRLTSKPRRALDTVILDAAQKAQVLADVEEYMDEATSMFYGNHGIPYRRGYLFHGPPGVGKTSFALALAARFSLDVYCLTLLDHDLTDSDLISLLNQLPSHSLLLLEDIDTAGLNRKTKGLNAARPSRRVRPARPGPGVPRNAGVVSSDKKDDALDSDDEGTGTVSKVSLSGLLNAIDGVAAPEGHILIMTTNKPYELDDALVRAGRISVRVEFKNASKNQAEEIFRRMYLDLPSESLNGTNSSSDAQSTPGNPSSTQASTEKDITALLPQLAQKFSSKIPEYRFSPADLQDYLLVHKKDPVKAVAGLEEWMEGKEEEARKRDKDKELEREVKREKAERERNRWKEEIREAVLEGAGEAKEKEKEAGKEVSK